VEKLPLFDQAAPFQVVAMAEPAYEGWLHLPALHARLLPLAKEAGHEKLLLTATVGQEETGGYYYEADCSGGPTGFRRYISFFDYGSAPDQFERRLTELLQQQAQVTQLSIPTQAA
jgi:hypothetical protein